MIGSHTLTITVDQKDDDFGGKTHNSSRGVPSAGDWVGVRFYGSGANASTLKNVHIRYAGRAAYIDNTVVSASAGLLFANNTNPTVNDVTVMRTASGSGLQSSGVLVYSASPNKISGITQNGFGGQTTFGLRLSDGATLNIQNSRFDGNARGLYARSGTVATVSDGGFCENTESGIYAENGSFVTATSSVISTNTMSGIRVFGGTHNFQNCEIVGNGSYGGIDFPSTNNAAVTINGSNLVGNGGLQGSTNLNVSWLTTPTINAEWNYWGEDGPSDEETTAVGIANWHNLPRTIPNSLYGEANLSINDVTLISALNQMGLTNFETTHWMDGGYLNYKIDDADVSKDYAKYVYPATALWNGYKPGVIREAITSDNRIITIKDVSNEPDPPPGALTNPFTYQIELNMAAFNNHIQVNNFPQSFMKDVIAHELGHCLGLGHNEDVNEFDVMTEGLLSYQQLTQMNRSHGIPLSRNDKASYDAAYKEY